MEQKYTPCIIIPGIGQSKIELLDENGSKLKMAWQLDIDTDSVVRKLKYPFIRSVILRNDLGLSKKMASIVSEIIDPIATNDDGTMKNPIRVVDYPQSIADCTEDDRNYIYRMVPMQRLGKIIGEDKLYFFSYNSFGEPYETAAMLNDFIQQIKKEHNCDKVNLVPVSMGGAVSIAYFDAYGHQDDIKRVMYFVAALQGTPVISDLMKLNINPDKAISLIEFLFPRKVSEMLKKILALLPRKVSSKMMLGAMKGLVDSAIIHCPSLWSTVPPTEYEALAEKHLSGEKYAVLRSKTDRFYKAQKKFPEHMMQLNSEGVDFFAVVGYNLQLLPIASADTASSDSMINVESASMGATAAPLGQKLGKEPDGNFISPDGTVDASTSLLPDRVWYFRNQQHDNTAYNDTALEIASRVLSDDSFTSVYSDKSLPRYGDAQDNGK